MALVLLLIFLIISWGITVGLTYLITLCFHLHFDLLIGTGVWLVLILINTGIKRLR
jgi:hypothetical protein